MKFGFLCLFCIPTPTLDLYLYVYCWLEMNECFRMDYISVDCERVVSVESVVSPFRHFPFNGHHKRDQKAGTMGESRTELIAWLNELLQLNYTKVEQCGTGAAYCQIMDSVYGVSSACISPVDSMNNTGHFFLLRFPNRDSLITHC